VVLVFNFRRSVAWRQFVLLAASFAFLGFFSIHVFAFVPLAAFLLFGFIGLRLMQAGMTRLYVPLLTAGIVAFAWLKKYSFIPPYLFLHHPYVVLGLSYIFFRVLHLIIDARSPYTTLPAEISLVSYLNYTLNFTTLIAGPIQRYKEFASMQFAPVRLPLNAVIAGEALERIIVGFFKVNVLSLALSVVQTSALSLLPTTHTASQRMLTAICGAGVYPFYLYCNFSGYIDIVIGIARFLRMKLPENFNRPFSSENYIIFWSRWHITLSNWLYAYVYGPLMIRSIRRWPRPSVEPLLAVCAYFVTFFLVGVWHGQTSVFFFFGFLLGLGVSVTKLYQVLMTRLVGRLRYKEIERGWLYNTAARGLTFTWSTFTLLWFWSNWGQLAFVARLLGPGEIALVWIAIFASSAVFLALWEIARLWLLSRQFEGQPLLSSRYIRTVWATVLAVVAITTVMLLNSPAPDIIYKTF
jgi:alginate O-acetyltransferase complex protein AlgI